MRLLANRLGHSRVRDLVERIREDSEIRVNRVKAQPGSQPRSFREMVLQQTQGQQLPLPPDLAIEPAVAADYIRAYFENVHPLFPFLERAGFEQRVDTERGEGATFANPPFSALYHAVLALGCQYAREDRKLGFEHGKGEDWRLFQFALSMLPDLLMPRDASLVHVQAMTAMAIFALNAGTLQVGGTLIVEAAHMARLLSFHRSKEPNPERQAGHRVFWVIYLLERQVFFPVGRIATISDNDIGCPAPVTPESQLDGFDTFLAVLRLGRLCSKTFHSLSAVNGAARPRKDYLSAIDVLSQDLRRWRDSVPVRFRPEMMKITSTTILPLSILRMHFTYYALLTSLCRLVVHTVEMGGLQKSERRRMESAKQRLMLASRAIIQLTTFIELKPYTPMW